MAKTTIDLPFSPSDIRAAAIFEAWWWQVHIIADHCGSPHDSAKAAWTAAQAASAERIAELERENYRLTRMLQAYEGKPDWEKLWAEQSERAETAESALAESERRREAAEKMLAEADAVIASNCGGYAFPHIRGTALAPCWDWKDQAVARHAARAKEGT